MRSSRGSQRPSYNIQEGRAPQTSLASLHGSIRKARSDTRSLISPPKTRSLPHGDKLKWDGGLATFKAFSKDLEGTLMKVGMKYMLKKDFQEEYLALGVEKMTEDIVEFYNKWGVTVNQFKEDLTSLYGAL